MSEIFYNLLIHYHVHIFYCFIFFLLIFFFIMFVKIYRNKNKIIKYLKSYKRDNVIYSLIIFFILFAYIQWGDVYVKLKAFETIYVNFDLFWELWKRA